MNKETIKCTDDNIEDIVEEQIELLGNEADLNHLDTSEVTNMGLMFFMHSQFTGDISKWDVSNVTDMMLTFSLSQFNGDISKWDVSNVTNMIGTFSLSQFTGDISTWDVSNVTDMGGMFKESQFNGDISKWDVSNVTDIEKIFDDCPIPEENKPKFED